jgi:hypothetical protein
LLLGPATRFRDRRAAFRRGRAGIEGLFVCQIKTILERMDAVSGAERVKVIVVGKSSAVP